MNMNQIKKRNNLGKQKIKSKSNNKKYVKNNKLKKHRTNKTNKNNKGKQTMNQSLKNKKSGGALPNSYHLQLPTISCSLTDDQIIKNLNSKNLNYMYQLHNKIKSPYNVCRNKKQTKIKSCQQKVQNKHKELRKHIIQRLREVLIQYIKNCKKGVFTTPETHKLNKLSCILQYTERNFPTIHEGFSDLDKAVFYSLKNYKDNIPFNMLEKTAYNSTLSKVINNLRKDIGSNDMFRTGY